MDAIENDFLTPNWPAPPSVRALCSTRAGGVSLGAYASLNLGDHVGDAPAAVAENRQRFAAQLQAHPVFLQQVHGNICLALDTATAKGSVADACSTAESNLACTIMVADCLPVLFCNTTGTRVAAAHAGWRGLAHGVLENTLRSFAPDDKIIAWLGPCIGQAAFEVGSEVRAAFVQRYPAFAAQHFVAGQQADKYQCDLSGLARAILQAAGVASISGNDGAAAWCSYSNEALWFSHRRESQLGAQSGRLAASVWLAACQAGRASSV